jgi:hypothetical protein
MTAPEEEQRAKEAMEEGRCGEALPRDVHVADRSEGGVTVTSVQAMLDRRESVLSSSIIR